MAPKVLVLEPFYSGSHKYLCDVLQELENDDGFSVRVAGWEGGSKWHWRMLVSAAHFAGTLDKADVAAAQIVMFSAMMNVAELLGFLPELASKRKLLYIHENQLEYPRSNQEAAASKGQSTFNLVWNQVASCMCVDQILFNSAYNRDSFFEKLGPFVNRIPTGVRPGGFSIEALQAKSKVLYLPITAPLAIMERDKGSSEPPLHLVWAHRWEYDKGPEAFLSALRGVAEAAPQDTRIKLSVLGGTASSASPAFEEALAQVSTEVFDIIHWGGLESREAYLEVLRGADVALSTSIHEFFGLSMLEAATCGCMPICPKRLSYPELFPKECLYSTERQLVKKILSFAKRPSVPRCLMSDAVWRTRLEKFQWTRVGSARDEWKTVLIGSKAE